MMMLEITSTSILPWTSLPAARAHAKSRHNSHPRTLKQWIWKRVQNAFSDLLTRCKRWKKKQRSVGLVFLAVSDGCVWREGKGNREGYTLNHEPWVRLLNSRYLSLASLMSTCSLCACLKSAFLCKWVQCFLMSGGPILVVQVLDKDFNDYLDLSDGDDIAHMSSIRVLQAGATTSSVVFPV